MLRDGMEGSGVLTLGTELTWWRVWDDGHAHQLRTANANNDEVLRSIPVFILLCRRYMLPSEARIPGGSSLWARLTASYPFSPET